MRLITRGKYDKQKIIPYINFRHVRLLIIWPQPLWYHGNRDIVYDSSMYTSQCGLCVCRIKLQIKIAQAELCDIWASENVRIQPCEKKLYIQ